MSQSDQEADDIYSFLFFLASFSSLPSACFSEEATCVYVLIFVAYGLAKPSAAFVLIHIK
jgi:hypothetical protein